MKQNITPQQLEELTQKQKEKLREWWKPEYGDQYQAEGSLGGEYLVTRFEEDKSGYQQITCESADMDGAYDGHDKKNVLPLLSIGQMIEFLFENNAFIFAYDTEGAWLEKSQNIVLYWGWENKENNKPELCDALWSAVKEVK